MAELEKHELEKQGLVRPLAPNAALMPGRPRQDSPSSPTAFSTRPRASLSICSTGPLGGTPRYWARPYEYLPDRWLVTGSGARLVPAKGRLACL